MDLLHVPLLVEEVEEDALLLLVVHRAPGPLRGSTSAAYRRGPAAAKGRQVLERQARSRREGKADQFGLRKGAALRHAVYGL